MEPIKKAVFVINDKKPNVTEVALQVMNLFEEHGKEVVCSSPGTFYNTYEFVQNIDKIADEKPDIAVIFGGDGTIINMAKAASLYGIPLLGVNLGTFGFLSVIEPDDTMKEDFEQLLAGNFGIENRLLLNCELIRDGQTLAQYTMLNDLVISNVDIARTIDVDVDINGNRAMSFSGNGLIVATPTGSTAYSLSAGGSIVWPGSDSILLTPICSHNLSVRPMVIEGSSKVRIIYQSENRYARLTMDGQSYMEINAGDQVIVSKSDKSAGFVWIGKPKFFEKVQNKFFNR